ncbi:carbonic anhydrase [Labrenzia sp. PHM005]|uniref:carbonic anhydrase n=1 Tax=Labrenzia sp. PHM005 TaxID=2590016 RepID=UPI0011401405|nr:carbonic anhydrase [Labrenzia sp. PHM005]QDG75815.1 carbonic anhydrase [Labrenzia sp. PHM005]
MTATSILLERNQALAEGFDAADLPILPKLGTMILTCIDARVDPAHILGLELGEAVVIRNNGGRVTDAVIQEIGAIAFMVKQMSGGQGGGFELVILQHTQCGAQRLADPEMQQALKKNLGIDVSQSAIHDHEETMKDDIKRLRSAPEIPDNIVVSALLYDVKTGAAREIVAPKMLGGRA